MAQDRKSMEIREARTFRYSRSLRVIEALTFLHAHLQQALPDRSVSVSEGLYGDLCGTLRRAGETAVQGIAVAMEWADLDTRLGYRSAGRWNAAVVDDIVQVAKETLDRIGAEIARIPPGILITLSMPGLPLPPLFQTTGWQASLAEIRLDEALSSFGGKVCGHLGLSIVNWPWLAEESPQTSRFDLKSELLYGFPYTASHANLLGAAHARLMVPAPPKK
jgi:hypothetical protein